MPWFGDREANRFASQGSARQAGFASSAVRVFRGQSVLATGNRFRQELRSDARSHPRRGLVETSSTIAFPSRSFKPTWLAAAALRRSVFRYAPSPDGKRFLINAQAEELASAPITAVLSWTAALQR